MSPRNRAAFLGVFLAAALAAANLGCGGASAAPPPPVISISLDNSSATLLESATQPFTATLVNDVNNKGVMWTVSCAVASCGSVSQGSTTTGVSTTFTAPGPPASDLTVTLKASAAADPTKSAIATITIPALSVSLSPSSATVQVAASLTINGSVNNDPSTGNLNWTLTENGNTCSPGCGTLSGTSGASTTYSAPATPPASNARVTLTGTSATDATKSASATLLIPSIGITVAPPALTVIGTKSVALTATLVNDKNNQGVNWAVSCPTPPCGIISADSSLSGVPITYTAPAPPASDLQVAVTATAVANSAAVASALVTVPAIVIDVEPQNPTVLATTKQQFTATVTNDPNNAGVTWSVTCSATPCGIALPATTLSGASVTYTAPPLPSTDLSVSVIATPITNTANSGQTTVTVPAIAVSAVTPPSGIVPITGMPQFSATVSFDPTGQGLNWTLTQNGSDCTPECGMMNPLSTGSPGTSSFNGPATLPVNPSVELNAVSITDPTKLSSATLTLTNGTVQLIPASLTTFSCKLNSAIPPLKCPPPSQNVQLTNTGATALAITSISTTGPFSATNTCGGNVVVGGSCSISVTFTARNVGMFSGTLNLSDSSADSPQKVTLQGRVISYRPPVTASGVKADLALTNSAAVPAPTGQNVVGTRVLELVDSSRKDPYDATRNSRELAIRLWYPVSTHSNQPCTPADYASPKVWEYFGQLLGVPTFPVATNSCQDAAVAEGVHPVVVFTPGLTATFTDYTFLMEDLASRGYIVVAVNHTYEATAVEFSDGRLVRSVVGSHLGGTVPRSPREARFAVDARSKDLKFVLGQIALLNGRRDSPFAGRFDLSKIVVEGHSLGGLTALLTMSDPHVKGAILIDPVLPDVLPGGTNKPVLILAADRENWAINECSLWSNLQGPRLAVTLAGTDHLAFSDWIWLSKDGVQTGRMGPQKAMSAMRDYVGAFLDSNLRGEPANPLLSGASLNYPDARVTVEGQSLCRNPMESVTAPVHPQR